MVLHPEEELGESYTLRMLSENRITGLLPFQEKRIDGETFLYFNITSRQSLARMMEYRAFQAREIRQITSDLIVTMTSLEKFLMEGDQLCLEPDMIYVDPDDLKANFCLLPGSDGRFEENFRKLTRYILDHVDHTDGDAVILAFALFRAGEKENLGIRDLERCLRTGENDGEQKNAGKSTGKGEIYESERKTVMEYGNGAPGEPSRYQESWRGESENQYRYFEREKADLPGETEALAEEKRLKERKNVFPILLIILMAAVPAAIYFIGGIEGILGWKWGILTAEGTLIAAMIFSGSDKNTEETEEPEEEWEVEFREEEGRERGGIPDEIEFTGPKPDTDRKEQDEMQTVLLTGRQIYPATRRLVPENGGEDVQIRYFPFIIGKNREISDLCLNLPQISRIHAKIEEDGDGYIVTDLNSTNGTSVNGRFLETNESARIEPGEMISFADQRYRFL